MSSVLRFLRNLNLLPFNGIFRLDTAQGPRIVMDAPPERENCTPFVQVAATYSARKGISYAAWRAVGVDAAVLNKAGIGRGG